MLFLGGGIVLAFIFGLFLYSFYCSKRIEPFPKTSEIKNIVDKNLLKLFKNEQAKKNIKEYKKSNEVTYRLAPPSYTYEYYIMEKILEDQQTYNNFTSENWIPVLNVITQKLFYTFEDPNLYLGRLKLLKIIQGMLHACNLDQVESKKDLTKLRNLWNKWYEHDGLSDLEESISPVELAKILFTAAELKKCNRFTNQQDYVTLTEIVAVFQTPNQLKFKKNFFNKWITQQDFDKFKKEITKRHRYVPEGITLNELAVLLGMKYCKILECRKCINNCENTSDCKKKCENCGCEQYESDAQHTYYNCEENYFKFNISYCNSHIKNKCFLKT